MLDYLQLRGPKIGRMFLRLLRDWAQVELTDMKFRNLPNDFALRPGMRVVADMNVGRRSVLEYILNPVTRIVSDSLREP